MSGNRIASLQLHLSASSRLAPAIPAACSRLFHRRLQNDLMKLLDVLDTGHPISIPTLLLDVGVLPVHDWEETLCARLIAALRAQLKVAALHVGRSPVAVATMRESAPMWMAENEGATQVAAGAAVDVAVTNQQPAEIDLPDTDLALTNLQLLPSYLLYGYAAPSLRQQFQRGDIAQWLAQQWQQSQQSQKNQVQSAVWAEIWLSCARQPQALRRLFNLMGRGVDNDDTAELGDSARVADATPSVVSASWHYRLQEAQRHPLARMPRHCDLPTPAMLRRYLLDGDIAPALQRLFDRGLAPRWFSEQLLREPSIWGRLLMDCCVLPRAVRRWLRYFDVPKQSVAVPAPLSVARTGSASEIFTVDGAGLVLLWPMLPGLLRCWGLTEAGHFIHQAAQEQAIRRLDAWLWQRPQSVEWQASFIKVLCGWPIEQGFLLPEQEDWLVSYGEDLDALAGQFMQQIPALQRCGLVELLHWFVQRPGKLRRENTHWLLRIERDASDVLLSELPWSVSQVSYPWLALPIQVEWL